MTYAWRNSLEARCDEWERRTDPPPVTSRGSPDLRHCLAVVRALGGRGFPFVAAKSAARAA